MASNGIALLRMSVGHLGDSRCRQAAVAAAHSVAARKATASRRVAAPWTIVGSLIDSDCAAIKPDDIKLAIALPYPRESAMARSREALLNVVHRRDGALGIVLVRVANKAKATAASSIAILNHDLDGRASC